MECEKLQNKKKKEAKNKQGSFEGKCKEEAVEKRHTRQKSQCWQCEGSSIYEHRRILRLCKQCNGQGICEHNRIESGCKQCGGSSICEHNRVCVYIYLNTFTSSHNL